MNDELMPEPEETATDSMAEVADRLEALLALVAGYRTKAMDQGFSEFSAEEMAVQVHAKLLED